MSVGSLNLPVKLNYMGVKTHNMEDLAFRTGTIWTSSLVNSSDLRNENWGLKHVAYLNQVARYLASLYERQLDVWVYHFCEFSEGEVRSFQSYISVVRKL